MDKPSCSKYSDASESRSQLIGQVLTFLKPLDELLKCHICFEYYNTCLITKCSHNFCSICIRRYMSYKAQCPQCFQETSEPELRSNRQIDEIVFLYNELQSQLESLAVSNTNPSTWKTEPLPKDSSINLNTQQLQTDDDDDISLIMPDVPSEDPNEEKVCPKSPEVLDKVQCPVCSALVLPIKINAHLDMCLMMSGNASYLEKDRRKQLPKVVYHLLSEKELKRRLKEHGLSTSGSKQTLIRRHKSFLLLYNSECDKLNPRPVSEIVSQVEKEENTKEDPIKLFQSNKKSSPIVIQEENEKYLKENEQQFKDLVSEIAMRQLQEKSSLTKGHCDISICSNVKSSQSDTARDIPLRGNSPDLFDDSPGSLEDLHIEKDKGESQQSSSDSDDDIVLISSQ